MDNTKIENALTRLFDEEGHRIVFWNDPDREFYITLTSLNLPDGVHILRLDQIPFSPGGWVIDRSNPGQPLTRFP
ncbi:MAG: hypothetical protein U5R49_02835 [Deltaproteobacteria bacterium]|nr:hypothetical protein [Deltaproteobacteria bacterium]